MGQPVYRGSATATTSPCTCTSAADEPYSDAELEAAVEALAEPGRFAEAEGVVARAAPQLQRILAQALETGGWFAESHEARLARRSRSRTRPSATAVRTLLAEEARMGMMVGVAVGWALAEELRQPRRGGLRCEISFIGHATFELADGDAGS